jgi:hypothetical protein
MDTLKEGFEGERRLKNKMILLHAPKHLLKIR